jgi:hypothetical protein
MASFLVLPLAGWKSRKVRKLLAASLIALIAAVVTIGVVGCGGAKNKTPAGTYTVTVTGASGSLTHNASYTLTVQ